MLSIHVFLDVTEPTYKSHCARDIATSPDFPKQCCTVAWKESVPLSFEFMTMSRIVQSTMMVRPMSRAVPVKRPALRIAYGWPMIPAPLLHISKCSFIHCSQCRPHIILLAMFMNALRIPLRGRALSRWSSGLKFCSATVTLGASMPVSRGSRCVLSCPSPSFI